MNFTESFQEFSSKLGPTDLALYAGVGLVLWVLFKDKLSPVQQFISTVISRLRGMLSSETNPTLPKVVVPNQDTTSTVNVRNEEDIFFKLVVSWKQTRDLAEASGCKKAVEVADQMFPYISPMVCRKEENVNES